MTPALRLLAFAAILWLASLFAGVASPAHAHSSLIASEPANRSVIATAPSRLVLRFGEPVAPLVLKLLSPNGKTEPLGASGPGAEIDLPVPPGLAKGTHALVWRVVSADGHPIGGTVVFSIGAPSEGFVEPERVDWPVAIFVWLTKLCLYVGLFAGIGGVAYGALVRPLAPAARLTTRIFLIAGLLAVPLALLAQGLDALGSPLTGLASPEVWRAGWNTGFGTTLLIAASSFVLGLIGLATGRRAAGIAALIGTGLALAASGHASTADPQWATRPAVFLHGVAVSVWIGGLLPLGLALQTGRADFTLELRRFSRLIPFFVAPLAFTGLLLATIQLGSVRALWTSAYGAVLLVKAALLLPLFALAAFNRWRLTVPAEGGSEPARERLLSSIALECALAFLILAVVATWRFTPPPRSLAESAAQPAVTRMSAEGIRAEMRIDPPRSGAVTASALVSDSAGKPFAVQEANFVFTQKSAGIQPIRVPAARQPDGTWRADAILPAAGRWTVRIDLLIDDFTLKRLEGTVELPAS